MNRSDYQEVLEHFSAQHTHQEPSQTVRTYTTPLCSSHAHVIWIVFIFVLQNLYFHWEELNSDPPFTIPSYVIVFCANKRKTFLSQLDVHIKYEEFQDWSLGFPTCDFWSYLLTQRCSTSGPKTSGTEAWRPAQLWICKRKQLFFIHHSEESSSVALILDSSVNTGTQIFLCTILA